MAKSTLTTALLLLAIAAFAPAAQAEYAIHQDYKLVDGEDQEWLSGATIAMKKGSSSTTSVTPETGEKFVEWRLYYHQASPTPGTVYETLGTGTSLTLSYNSKFEDKITYSDLYLKPCFSSWEYGVEYNTNQGSWDPSWYAPATGPWKYSGGGTFPTKDNVKRTGYELSCWTMTNKSFEPGSAFTGSSLGVSSDGESVKLTAQWTPESYVATIAPGDGGTGGCTVEYTFSESSQTKTITLPTYDAGHSISGWTATEYSGSQPTISGNILTIPARTSGDFTMTPTWAAVKCSLGLSDDGRGSTSVNPTGSPYDYGKSIKITAEPSDGYSFAYWETGDLQQIYTNPYTFTITSDVQFQANFTSRVCTVTFDPTGGTCSESSRSVTWGNPVGALPKATYGARDFKGWFNAEVGGTEVTQDAIVDGDKTFYAHWGAAVTYTITTVASPSAGGTVTGGGQHDKDAVTNLVAVANDGYSFEKWEDTESPDATRQITVTGDATYTACFTGNVYRITFDAVEGEVSVKGKFYVTFGSPYNLNRNLPVPTPPEGQQFVGWYTEEEGGELVTDDSTVAIAENHTLFAHYGDITYTYHYVRFDGNGATNATPMAVQTFTIGQPKALAANEYGTNGCSFAGWATNSGDAAACRVAYTNCQSVTFTSGENETNVLYAAWKLNSYPLELRLGTGVHSINYTIGGASPQWATADTNINVTCGTTWTATAWTKGGYHFGKSSAFIDAAGTMTADGFTFAPEATPNTYAVTYGGNGETGGSMSDSVFTYDRPTNLPSNQFERIYTVSFKTNSGDLVTQIFATSNSVYAFAGWATNSGDAAACRVTYADGASVSNLAYSGSATLYAVWTTNAASVVTLPPAPDRAGFAFTGWTDGTTSYDAGDTIVPTGHMTIYGTWTVNDGELQIVVGKGIQSVTYATDVEWEGGSWTGKRKTTETSCSEVVNEGKEWAAYAVAKVGYTYTETSEQNPTNGTVQKGVTTVFSPQATANAIPVSYVGAGATGGEMSASAFTYDTPTNLPACGFTRAYAVTFDANGGTVTNAAGAAVSLALTNSVYAFAGWATNSGDAAACRVTYADGQTVTNLSTGADVTLYTVWTTNAASVVTLPAAMRADYTFTGWEDAVSHRVYGAGATLVPTNGMSFVAQWQLVVGPLSEAVGLTNAVLKATADTTGTKTNASWQAVAGTGIPWDRYHDSYVKLVANGESVSIGESSPLRLSLKVNGPGKLDYQIYWNPTKLTMQILDVQGATSNEIGTVSSSASLNWDTESGKKSVGIGSGEHEILWLVTGTLDKDDKIALDNMTWTPDAVTPTVVTPGGAMPTYATQDEAEAAAANAVVVPPNADVSNACKSAGVDYNAMFAVRAVENAAATSAADAWTHRIELTESVSNEVQQALNVAATNLIDAVTRLATADAEALRVTMTTKPGLYYGIAATNEVVGLRTSPSAAEWRHSVTNWALATGVETEIGVDLPSPAAGFFEPRATATPPTP